MWEQAREVVEGTGHSAAGRGCEGDRNPPGKAMGGSRRGADDFFAQRSLRNRPVSAMVNIRSTMFMKAWIAVAVLLVFSLFPANLQGASSETRIRQKIETLLRDPMSDSAKAAGAEIIEFAGKSPDYHIELEVGYMPWVKDRGLPKGSQILLAAFIAGNLREQMRKSSSTPEPYAGVLAALDVYQKVKRTNGEFHIPKAEKFLAMERAGTLKQHIAAVR